MNVLEKLQALTDGRKKTAIGQYKSLLERLVDAENNPAQSDIEQLEPLANALERSPENVEQDLNTLKRQRELAVEIKQLDQRRAAAALASKAVREHNEKMKVEIAKLEAKLLELNKVKVLADQLLRRSNSAEIECLSLLKGYPHLQ